MMSVEKFYLGNHMTQDNIMERLKPYIEKKSVRWFVEKQRERMFEQNAST